MNTTNILILVTIIEVALLMSIAFMSSRIHTLKSKNEELKASRKEALKHLEHAWPLLYYNSYNDKNNRWWECSCLCGDIQGYLDIEDN